MLYLRDKQLPYLVREIAEGDVFWLLEQLELASTESADFYVTRETIESLVIAGASAPLLESLNAVMSGRDDADIEVVHRVGSGYEPALFPATERPQDSVASDLSNLDAVLPATLDSSATDSDDALLFDATESDAEDTTAVEPTAPGVEVAGRTLLCVVCGGGQFQRRVAQLHSPIATFFGVEWMGRNAVCYICDGCGYVHWFVK